ncbi:Uncharacterized protein AC507_5271 [Pseudomonas syringae pv. maculicola]|nr:Uncharacterized protein AC507_5271 [Pseudomonas syringae pv. maculicola]
MSFFAFELAALGGWLLRYRAVAQQTGITILRAAVAVIRRDREG